MYKKYKIDRFELSGSLGDLGTLLPIGLGMILVNHLSPSGIFFSFGLLYIVTGWYYGIPVSVQPMKVIASHAIVTGMTFQQIQAASLLMFFFLVVIALTGSVNTIEKYIPKSTIIGVQLSTGVILMTKGINFVLGTSDIQKIEQLAEPYLSIQYIGIVPVGIIIGIISFVLILFLVNNKQLPAGIVILILGLCLGLCLGLKNNIEFDKLGIRISEILPLDMPKSSNFDFALIALVVSQVPMTIGNAVIANKDLSILYFGKHAKRVTNRALCFTMAIGTLLSMFFSGMPICHGSGGLAAHYRFGARSAGSNLIIGIILLLLAGFLGDQMLFFIRMIPMSVLGILLLFAGSQLVLNIMTIQSKDDIFVIFLMLAITLVVNLGVGFIVGIITSLIFRFKEVKI